ncbi:MAG: outer membrane protein transport protein [Rhodobacter sp.]|nr:outer membrane protein transport protein [Rhodobacter sp.]
MKRFLITAAAGALAASGATAGGLDRSGQPIGIIFEQGNYAELSFSTTRADVTGTGVGIGPVPPGTPYGNVAGGFVNSGAGFKYDFTDNFSLALIWDQPFGSDVTYPGAPGATELGGTTAIADAVSLTAIGRYKFSDKFSVHGGVRHQTIDGNIGLSGLSYGPLNGYNVALGSNSAMGFVVGGAFELPQYAARVALTYNSEITHSTPTVETLGGIPVFGPSPNTEIKSPASINLDFQTGLNEKTLLFGSVRYAMWSDLIISPRGFDLAVDGLLNQDSISDLEDTFSYSLGIGRAINENWSVSGVLGYEPEGSDDLVSPLAPTNGNFSVGIGVRYKDENVVVSGGIRHTWLGDARPETGTPDTARATFTDNTAISAGFKIGIFF